MEGASCAPVRKTTSWKVQILPLVRPGFDTEALNQLNRALLQCINDKKRVYLSGALLGDCFVLRICVLSFRTHLDRMQMGIEDIRAAVREICHEAVSLVQ